ncbi:hypothetical protein [Vacuolonema iberomarrocanum]|uniref:hypothetical protein n=1 Tax=Vacuolonema iberomarrocanum TaxID=3454632 RepID=UPI001A036C79|nr:hypothetical protein [filamentous cyanobacterium LEGE 07170]
MTESTENYPVQIESAVHDESLESAGLQANGEAPNALDCEQRIAAIASTIESNVHQVSASHAFELAQMFELLGQVSAIDDEQTRYRLLQLMETSVAVLSKSSNSDDDLTRKAPALVFAEEIRKKVDIQSRNYPNPFTSLFRQYRSLEDRLLSGIVWFFSFFFVLPGSVILGLLIFSQTPDQVLREQQAALEEQVSQLEARQESLRSTLQQAQEQFDNVLPSPPKDPANTRELTLEPEELIQLQALRQTIDANLTLTQDDPVLDDPTTDGDALSAPPETVSASEQADNDASAELVPGFLESLGIKSEDFFQTDLFLGLVAITMGALGSCVSVITSSEKFLNRTRSQKIDPFYIGFFRPFVGMAFAIFIVALLESGIFGSILNISSQNNTNPGTRKVYLFAAIAFIAGFSERFAPGIADQISSRTGSSEKTSSSDN